MTKKRIIIASLFVFIIVISIIYRYIQVYPYPIGTGEESTSPNGKYIASITSYNDMDFWGRETSWFEFELTNKSENSVIHRLKTEPIPGPYFGSRSSHNVIFWSEDSKEVKYIFPAIDICIKTKPAKS